MSDEIVNPRDGLPWWQRALSYLPGAEVVDEADAVIESPAAPPRKLAAPVLQTQSVLGKPFQQTPVPTAGVGLNQLDPAHIREVAENRSEAVFALPVMQQLVRGIEEQEEAIGSAVQLDPVALRKAAIASYVRMAKLTPQQISALREQALQAGVAFDQSLNNEVTALLETEVSTPQKAVQAAQDEILQITEEIARLTARKSELTNQIGPTLGKIETGKQRVQRNRATFEQAAAESTRAVEDFFALVSAGYKPAK